MKKKKRYCHSVSLIRRKIVFVRAKKTIRLSLAVRHTKEINIGFSLGRGLLNATTTESCCIQNEWRSQINSHEFLKGDIIIFGVDLKLGIILRRGCCNWFYNCGLIQKKSYGFSIQGEMFFPCECLCSCVQLLLFWYLYFEITFNLVHAFLNNQLGPC